VTGILGVEWLFARRARPFVLGVLGAASVLFCWHVWRHHFVVRYYGEAPWSEQFHRMSFDRPWFIVPATYWVVLAALFVLVSGYALLLVRGGKVRASSAA
jgi:hypothetical protein